MPTARNSSAIWEYRGSSAKDNLSESVLRGEILVRSIKKTVRSLMPPPVLQALGRFRMKHGNAQYRVLTTQQVFTKIYEEGAWGRSDDPSQRFYSGSGSHDESVAGAYVDAIRAFLSAFKARPSVVDLGCGDFHVGSQIRSLCKQYVACDIVEPLVMFNKEKYKSLDVDFRLVDMTRDELPRADIVFVRQVLQHLSNKQISSALPQIAVKYKYLVLTEHLPSENDFVPNLDKAVGADFRLKANSGVILTRRPFNLKVKSERRLCEVPEQGGRVVTMLYELM
jgi:SAM-dependent methyltransferase